MIWCVLFGLIYIPWVSLTIQVGMVTFHCNIPYGSYSGLVATAALTTLQCLQSMARTVDPNWPCPLPYYNILVSNANGGEEVRGGGCQQSTWWGDKGLHQLSGSNICFPSFLQSLNSLYFNQQAFLLLFLACPVSARAWARNTADDSGQAIPGLHT